MTHSFPTRRSSDLNPIYRKLYFKLSEKVIYFCHARARPCGRGLVAEPGKLALGVAFRRRLAVGDRCTAVALTRKPGGDRSEEHTSELQSLMRISYAVFCLKKKKNTKIIHKTGNHNTQHNRHKHIKTTVQNN